MFLVGSSTAGTPSKELAQAVEALALALEAGHAHLASGKSAGHPTIFFDHSLSVSGISV